MSQVYHVYWRNRYESIGRHPLSNEGLEILKEHFTVDVITGLSEDELTKIHFKDYDALVIEAAPLSPNLSEAADRLKVIGRAGVGVDNVDVDSATKKGIHSD